MVILGCDVSTTTVGYCFLNNEEIVDMGFIDISKQKTLKEKAITALESLQEKQHFSEVEKVCVEDSLSSFAYGRSSIQTIIKLAKFNAIFCFLMEWGSDDDFVESINPNTARKMLFGKTRKKGKTAKEFVRYRLEHKYDLSKFQKLNTKGNFDRRNIDAYDAAVCALAYSKKINA